MTKTSDRAGKRRAKRRGPKPRPKSVPRTLTDRQLAFCREYLKDYIGVKAAIRAGYSTKGAAQQASVLLRNPKVQAELSRLGARIKKKAELSAVALLDSVTAVAFGDIRDLFTETGRMKKLHELSPQTQALIAGWKGNGADIEVKIENRMRARELLMKHLGLLKEHIRLEQASELTMEEEETISKMSNEELREFRAANETVERMLHPEEVT